MPATPTENSPSTNHIFVDFENVHEIDLKLIGSKVVTFTLLLGACQTKLDVSLVEELLKHAASVQLVRLTSVGRNALDFTLAYYLGRSAAADPTGFYHIVSKDTGYDPLIEHLRSRSIRARRHNDFSTLTFAGTAKPKPPTPPATVPKLKSAAKARPQPPTLDELESQVLEHWRKPAATRPRNRKKLVSFLIAHLGNTITEGRALELVDHLGQAGHLAIDEKGVVTYHVAHP